MLAVPHPPQKCAKNTKILIIWFFIWEYNIFKLRYIIFPCSNKTLSQDNWLVVEPPLWKIWVRQLGVWISQLNGRIIHSCPKAPTRSILVNPVILRYLRLTMYIPQLRIIQQHPTASNITADTMRAMLIQLDDLQHPGVLDVFEWEETAFQWMLNQVISCHFDFWCVSAALRAQPGTPNDGKMVLLGEPFLRSNIHHLRRQIRRYSKKISKENGQYLQNIRFFSHTPQLYFCFLPCIFWLKQKGPIASCRAGCETLGYASACQWYLDQMGPIAKTPSVPGSCSSFPVSPWPIP